MKRRRAGRLALLLLLLAVALGELWVVAGRPQLLPGPRWYRGCLHAHSRFSDGSATPQEVVEWYRGAGYHFLALTEHDELPYREGNDPAGLLAFDQLVARYSGGSFVLLLGQEISGGTRDRPVHLNAFHLGRVVPPVEGTDAVRVMQRTLRRVEALAEPGVPVLVQLNHPNFRWAVAAEDLLQVPELRLFEVYNPHGQYWGDGAHPSTDQVWDEVLAGRYSRPDGQPLYGTAVDDSHRLQPGQVGGTDNGWVEVLADRLAPEALLASLARGRFYASTGVRLRSVGSDASGVHLEIDPEPGASYRTLFLGTRPGGPPGEVLAESLHPSPSYRFRGDELYVRARVESSRRHPCHRGRPRTAWTQPVPGPACSWPREPR